jgi:creatinine amidohydrolase
MPNPIPARDTVFIEEMTWMEVRDALRAGKKTVIVPTGGLEMNGPYLVTGKHDYVLRATTESLARTMGNTLVAPIVAFVPQGDIAPPTDHMRYPGTISLTEDTFRRLLTDICRSLHAHGFENIVLIGDSGGNQPGMKAVAESLNSEWKGKSSRVYHVPEYFNYPAVDEFLEASGIKQVNEGLHDDFGISAVLMSVDPNTVRMKERIATGKFRINGIELAPADKTIEWGKKIVEHRTKITLAALRKQMASK